jgi:hypothetical protein
MTDRRLAIAAELERNLSDHSLGLRTRTPASGGCEEAVAEADGIKKDVSRNAVILPEAQPRWRPNVGKDARAFERHPAKPPPTFLF